MSEKMLTGDGRIDTVYANTYSVLWKGNLEIAEGLGLLDSVIIDQHFVARSRYNRLISAVIEMPGYQAVGIDESTAILVSQGKATVVGASQVINIGAPQHVLHPGDTLLNAHDISVDIFIPGDVFDIKN
jgi:cyanophycinase